MDESMDQLPMREEDLGDGRTQVMRATKIRHTGRHLTNGVKRAMTWESYLRNSTTMRVRQYYRPPLSIQRW